MWVADTNAELSPQIWRPMQVRGRGDREIERVAIHAMVTREQLIAAGLSRGAIDHRVKTGRLHRRYPGVFLIGRATPERWSAEAAAVLHCGGYAALSHASAAALWGLLPQPAHEVTVTRIGGGCRSQPGLVVHRAVALERADLRIRYGLPVTAPARTIIDNAPELARDALEQVLAQARVERLLRDGELEAALDRAGRRRGTGEVRALLKAEGGPAFTRRDAERRMLALVRQAGLRVPRVNAPLLGFEVDFLWERERLVVETDGYQFHGHRLAYETDRRRDQILLAAGYRVMRITWRQLRDEPLAVIARLAMALAARAA